MGRFLKTFLLLRAIWIVALLTSSAHGQIARTGTQPETVVDILHELSEKADIIFAGQVLAIRHPDSGVVEVEFRVDQAIRGCTAGSPYILREWAGLWAGDSQRYRVGQRLLMLLHAPSAAGMSSPVGGLDGAIPIRQGGVANPSAEVATPPQPPYVDLRWLGAKLTHAVSYRSEPVHAAKPADRSIPFFGQQAAYGTVFSSMSSLAPSKQTLDDAQPERSFSAGAAGLGECCDGYVELVAKGASCRSVTVDHGCGSVAARELLSHSFYAGSLPQRHYGQGDPGG